MVLKRKSQKVHAKRRFIQRFGLFLSDQQYEQIVRDIQSQKAQFIEKQSNRVTLWRVIVEDNEVVVVYDKERKSISTVLP